MKTTFKPQIKKPKIKLSPIVRMLLIYFICAITAFVFLAGIGSLPSSLGFSYFILFLGVVGLGVLHIWLMHRFFEWDDPYQQKLLFSLAVAAVGLIVFFLFFKSGVRPYSFLSLGFLLPMLFQAATEHIDAIPAKLFKSYRITSFDDVDRSGTNFEENKYGLMWIFEGDDDENLPEQAVKMFAPKQVFDMPFKTLFKAALLFHNVRIDEENPINIFFLNEVGEKEPYDWYFMHSPGMISGQKYIDPDKTVQQNGLNFKKRKTSLGGHIWAPKIHVLRKKR